MVRWRENGLSHEGEIHVKNIKNILIYNKCVRFFFLIQMKWYIFAVRFLPERITYIKRLRFYKQE